MEALILVLIIPLLILFVWLTSLQDAADAEKPSTNERIAKAEKNNDWCLTHDLRDWVHKNGQYKHDWGHGQRQDGEK